MRSIVTTITSGGQITLPAEVRRLLGVKPRDKVALEIDGTEVRIVPAKYTIQSIAGSLKPTTTEDIQRFIKEAMEEAAEEEFKKLQE